MGGSYSISNFPFEEEIDIYKLYFSTENRYKKNINCIDFKINIGNNNKNISSIVYTLQFIEKKDVLDEITITIRYQKK